MSDRFYTRFITNTSLYILNNLNIGVIELSHLSINYLLKDDFLLSPYELSLATGVMVVPWVIKPLWGFISDSFPILGYRRKTYLIFLSFLQFVIWVILSLWVYNVWLTIVLLFVIEFCIAFCNVIAGFLLFLLHFDLIYFFLKKRLYWLKFLGIQTMITEKKKK